MNRAGGEGIIVEELARQGKNEVDYSLLLLMLGAKEYFVFVLFRRTSGKGSAIMRMMMIIGRRDEWKDFICFCLFQFGWN